MGSGLLQLVARGIEDIFLINDPQITFFKTVYRRHTNFSIGYHDLSFSNRLDFGKEGFCRIERNGDLLHRLFLIVNLPNINIRFNKPTYGQVKDLVSKYGIDWEIYKSRNDPINEEEIYKIEVLIKKKISEHQDSNKVITNIFNRLNEKDIPSYIYNKLIKNFPEQIMYWVVSAMKEDLINSEKVKLFNLKEIKDNLQNEFDTLITNNDKNIEIYSIINKINENFFKGESSEIMNILHNCYKNGCKDYVTYDSYKIVENVLKTNPNITKKNLLKIIKSELISIYDNLKQINNLISTKKIGRHVLLKKYKYNKLKDKYESNLHHESLNSFKINKGKVDELNGTNLILEKIKKKQEEYQDNSKKIVNNEKLNQYFEEIIKLWSRTNLTNPVYNINLNDNTIGNNIFLSNNIWFMMNHDIPEAINTYLRNNIQPSGESLNDGTLIDNFYNKLMETRSFIENILREKLQNSILTIKQQLPNFNENKEETNNDIELYSILDPEFNTIQSQGTSVMMLPDYIVNNYLNIIENFSNHNGIIKDRKDILKKIVKLFVTAEDKVPDYNIYVQQNYNISDLKINNIGNPPNNIIYSDLVSSIWNNIFFKQVKSYNDFYKNNILDKKFYETNYGIKMIEGIDFIKNNLNLSEGDSNNIYLNKNWNMKKEFIDKYIEDNKNELLNNISNYEENKNINIKSVDIVDYIDKGYSEMVDDIFDSFNKKGDINENLKNIKEHFIKKSKDDNKIKTIGDIIKKIKSTIELFIDDTEINPFNLNQSHQYKLWELHKNTSTLILSKEEKNQDVIIKKIVENIINYGKENNNKNSDIFSSEVDVYRFILERIKKENNIEPVINLESKDDLVNYFKNKQDGINKLIDKLSNEGLINILRRGIKNKINPKFAWIRRIGHYLIKSMWIVIGDQSIDRQYGEWLEIWHSLTKIKQKEKGYNHMIGDIPELYRFDSKTKEEYQLIIPLQFWFCRFIGQSLPLIALNNTEIKLYFKLRDFNEVCYHEPDVIFNKKPKLNCKILAEYIYLESEEREKFAKTKLEYLIDIIQYNGETSIGKGEIYDKRMIKTNLYYQNPTKEIVWFLQNNNFINGNLSNGERTWHLYSLDQLDKKDIIKKALIELNNRTREEFKESIFYNTVQPYERHTSDPNTGVCIYSLSLYPESQQPSGTINLSYVDNLSIVMELTDETIKHLQQGNILRFGSYCISYNILRIYSGISGLVFTQ